MKIAYCIPNITTSGGIERVLANKSRCLLEKGHEIYFIIAEKENEEPFFDFDKRIIFYYLDCKFTSRGIIKKNRISKKQKHIPK